MTGNLGCRICCVRTCLWAAGLHVGHAKSIRMEEILVKYCALFGVQYAQYVRMFSMFSMFSMLLSGIAATNSSLTSTISFKSDWRISTRSTTCKVSVQK